MKRNEISEIIEQYPMLNSFGFGLFNGGKGMSEEEKQSELVRHRNELLESGDRCDAVCQWLENVAKIKSINQGQSSYGLKHIAEDDIGYVTNGVFICTAIHMGFRCEVHGPNAYFNMSQRDLNRKRKK